MSIASSADPRATGHCLCGAVRYAVHGPLRPPMECHCGTCRRSAGGLWHATAARHEQFALTGEDAVCWYRSSGHARRGFCGRCGQCGTKLFYRPDGRHYISLSMGSLDAPTGEHLAMRIMLAHRGDYYDPEATLPGHADGNTGRLEPVRPPPDGAVGQCLCGGVRYRVRGRLSAGLECHCHTCRRFSGGLWHATGARRDDLQLEAAETLRWYRSSPPVQRGFCGTCGSSLFWDRDGVPFLGLTLGALEPPGVPALAARIFLADQGDYYTVGESLPGIADSNHGLEFPAA